VGKQEVLNLIYWSDWNSQMKKEKEKEKTPGF